MTLRHSLLDERHREILACDRDVVLEISELVDFSATVDHPVKLLSNWVNEWVQVRGHTSILHLLQARNALPFEVGESFSKTL